MTIPAPDVAPTLQQLAFGDLSHELQQTRRILERLPDDRLDFRPHAKSWTLGEIATHVASLPMWGTAILTGEVYDLATGGPRRAALPDRAAVLAEFESHVAAMGAALEATDDAKLMATWQLRRGDHVIMAMPRAAALRAMVISHLIHHRGQLSVYLRLTDTPVPGLYGPSADD